MFLQSLIPKDLKGLLKLGDLIVPGISNIEEDIVAIWGLVKPLLKEVPKALERFIPVVSDIAVAVLNDKDPSDEKIVQHYKVIFDKTLLKKVIEVAIAPETEALLDKAISYDLGQVKAVKSHAPLIKEILKQLKKLMNALQDARGDGKYVKDAKDYDYSG